MIINKNYLKLKEIYNQYNIILWFNVKCKQWYKIINNKTNIYNQLIKIYKY